MRTVVFVGPTLPQAEIHELLPSATLLPPAEQGDIDFAHRVLKADVIGLIDGVHTNRLPVWHKEILHVLSQGARVIGAASMGALRAVECEPWGAEPIGEVAGWLKDGTIEADDEVCLAHAGKSHGYKALSLPLVNVRATLVAAKVEKARGQDIRIKAGGIFYANRTWKAVFDAAECSSTEREQILACELDIKAADAMHLCYHIQQTLGDPVGHRRIPTRDSGVSENGGSTPPRPIVNADKGFGGVFLRNDRKLWTGKKILRQHQLALPSFRNAALNRALALEYCKLMGLSEVAPDYVPGSIKGDYAAEDISEEDFKKLRNEEATLARGREWFSNAASGFEDVPKTLDFMRITGAYQKVKETIHNGIQ